MYKLPVVNLFGQPNAGKSTIQGAVYSKLKKLGVNCEMVREFAKELVWRNDLETLSNQVYVFGEQQRRQRELVGKVDVVINDSPLLLSVIYDAEKCPDLAKLVMSTFDKYDNLNFLIMMAEDKPYNPKGRLQSEDEAALKHLEIVEFLVKNNIPRFTCFGDGDDTIKKIVQQILLRIQGRS